MKKYFLIFGVALGGATLGAGTVAYIVQKQTKIQTKASNAPISLTKFSGTLLEQPNFVTTAAIANQAVVHIKVKTSASEQPQGRNFDPFRDFFDFKMPQGPQEGSGSGVIIRHDGYIVTNNHVVENADKVEVILFDKREFNATVIGKDPNTDLALIKIDEKELPTLTWGNSDDLQVGEWVLAVGNPFNLTSTVTAGIVSAKARNINILGRQAGIESFIQTDAAINPGNSGGALVNVKGELIGINAAIASSRGSYEGYGFAIPSALAQKVVGDFIAYGKVQRGFLGVMMQEVNAELAEKEGLKVVKGVYVSDFPEGSAAERAGIKKGDIIVKVDQTEVNKASELQEIIGRHRPGDKVKVLVNRSGENKEFTVTLRDADGNTSLASGNTSAETYMMLGAQFEQAAKKELTSLKLSEGIKVTKIGAGKLREAGMREGFIITKVSDQIVKTPKELLSILNKTKGGVLLEGYYPNGQKAYYGIGV